MYSPVNTQEFPDYPESEMDDRESLYFDTISLAGSEIASNRKSLSQSRMTIYHSAVDLTTDGNGTINRDSKINNSTKSFGNNSNGNKIRSSLKSANQYQQPPVIESEDLTDGINMMGNNDKTWRRFVDGQRTVDFVLAYYGADSSEENAKKREIFETNLENEGLQLEREQTQKIHFVKIHAPVEVLSRHCEILKIKMPIKKLGEQEEINAPEFQLIQNIKSFFGRPFQWIKLDPVKFPEMDYTIYFEYSRNYQYLFDEESPNFFDSSVRTSVIQFILERQHYNNTEDAGTNLGITKLLHDGVYDSAYPLHDGNCKTAGSQRNLLLNEWGSVGKWIKHQPLDNIKMYFGAKIALYFAWLGFYTHMLIPISIFGVFTFLYGLATMSSDQLSNDICNDNQTIIMCPQCDRKCDFWLLSETCKSSKFNYIIDNNVTVVFAFFLSLWAVVYLELWKRYSANLIHRWGLNDFSHQVEHPRPEYLARLSKLTKTKFNVIHKVLEPHVPFWKMKFPSYIVSYSVVLLFICLSVIAIFSLIVYRMAQRASRNILGNEDSMSYKIMVLPMTAGIIDLIVISLLDYAYSYLAVYLTNLEYRRTQTEYDDSLTIKNCLFQFVNYYSSLFYIAFLKGKFVGYPKKYNRILGFRQEECNPGGCLMELCIQLVIIMIGKQAVNAILETLIPFIMKSMNKIKIKIGLIKADSKDKLISCNQWTEDYHLLPYTQNSLFLEYLEMVLQFGFITIFGIAFPLAPLFALINNFIEVRLDAMKILKFYRRPIPQRANSIGVWFNVMVVVTKLAVAASAFIIAFGSNLIPKIIHRISKSDQSYLDFTLAYFNTSDFQTGIEPKESLFSNVEQCRYPEFRNPPTDAHPYKRPLIYWHILAARLAFIVVFQNVVGMIQTIVAWAIPDTPGKLVNKIKREEYLTREIIIQFEKKKATEQLIKDAVNGLQTIVEKIRPHEKKDPETYVSMENESTSFARGDGNDDFRRRRQTNSENETSQTTKV